MGREFSAMAVDLAAGDLCLVAFYFLLRAGEYVKKASQEESKQTVQFRLRDVAFFEATDDGMVRQIPPTAPAWRIQNAVAATLRLSNQKNGIQNACIHHEANGQDYLCPVKALVRRFLHIRTRTQDWNTFLSAYWDEKGVRCDVTSADISTKMKWAGICLHYPSMRGIEIDSISTHSLRAGEAMSLHLNGYSDREIQKMGRWRGQTFKEYIREGLSMFSKGMSTSMSKTLKYVNIEGGFPIDITTAIPYQENEMNQDQEFGFPAEATCPPGTEATSIPLDNKVDQSLFPNLRS